MEKSAIIQDFCSEILEYPVTLNEEITENLLVAAGLVEDDITKAGCDVLGKSTLEHAQYIRENIMFCSKKIQDDAYFLMIELSCNTLH